MHEVEDIEGSLTVRWTDWVAADHQGTRRIRPDGYLGSPTAELVMTALGWVGRSWIMRPSRVVVFPRDMQFEWAVHLLETAEAEGQDAAAWWPVYRPGADLGNIVAAMAPPLPEQRAEVFGAPVGGDVARYLPVFGASGVVKWLLVINGVLVTGRGGEAVVFEDDVGASFHAFRELLPAEVM